MLFSRSRSLFSFSFSFSFMWNPNPRKPFFVVWFCSSLSQAGESNGLLKKTISKLSTEYRLQFVWPTVRRIKGGGEATSRAAAGDYPRKSISLGALRSGGQSHSHTQNQSQSLTQTQNGHTHHTMMGGGAGLPTVHKKRTTNQKEGATTNCRR